MAMYCIFLFSHWNSNFLISVGVMLYILIKNITEMEGMKSYTAVQFTNMENNFLNISVFLWYS